VQKVTPSLAWWSTPPDHVLGDWGIPDKETVASIDIERSRFVKHEGLVAKHSLTKSKKPLRYQGRGRGGTGRRKGLKISRRH
jgi:hypothetical protein